jgi:CubicO group peptidase (beta-lactamase class C family)
MFARNFSSAARRPLAHATLLAAAASCHSSVASHPSAPGPSVAIAPMNPQSLLPDTPAARQFFALLAVFNSGERGGMRSFLQANFPEQVENLDDDMRLRKATGGFDVRKIESSSPTLLTGLLQERDSDQFFGFTMEVEDAEPHRISGMEVRPVPRPPEFPLSRLPEAELVTALRDRLERAAAADRFSGAVLWTQGDHVVFRGAYGLANREKAIPNTLDAGFRIGSMNKMFTAVCVLQLVQAGKMRLSDPIGTYLSGYPNKELASKVTLHQLLTHTGGTGDFFGPEFDEHRTELRTLQDYVALFGKRGPEFRPGSRHVYSNYGFLLLGLAIEKASGQSYYDYVSEHVYKPAGMNSTGSLPEDAAVPDRTIGYTTMDGGESLHPNTNTLPYRGTPAGGGYSTVGDLQRFAVALIGHKLLDAQQTDLLLRGKVDTPMGSRYAYGFVDRTEGGVHFVGHSGGAPGMNGELRIYPESGYTVVVLANVDPPAAQHVAAFVGARLPER